jgi:two-component system CheB/CheR fusion protein
VQTPDGHIHTLRIQPYRTLDNVIEGAVISFVDITEVVRAREALHQANDLLRLAVVVRDAHDAITVQNLQGQTLAWNPGAERLYGWTEAQALNMNVSERIPPSLREGAIAKLASLSRAEVLQPYLTQRLTASGAMLEVSIISTALLDPNGVLYGIATTERAKRSEAPGSVQAAAA